MHLRGLSGPYLCDDEYLYNSDNKKRQRASGRARPVSGKVGLLSVARSASVRTKF